jgi:RNA polymerase sigma-70 factor (ECF subfamily)
MDTVLRQAICGDSQAFAEIVREHQAMIFSIGWHFLGDRALAEDVAQEVFLELYRRLSAMESAAHLTHWLRRVAVHRSIDLGRRKRFRKEVALEELHQPVNGDGPADSFLSARLRQALVRLPDKQRMMIVLRYQEDLGPAEIAALMDMPVNTVKSTLHRALEQLRGKLAGKLKEARYAFF